jgi:hypothetical protein
MGEGRRLLGNFRGGGNMRVGTLIKRIEFGDMGVITLQGLYSDLWLIHFINVEGYRWCSECELEVLCV